MDENEEDILTICMGFLLILSCYFLQNENRIEWWVRPVNAERNEKGAFANIFLHMKNNDPEMFFKYTRMQPRQFDNLLNLLRPKLLKRSRREFLSPDLRLALTLKYLAHGGYFLNISWEFRVGQSTASNVIFETCNAIWEILQPVYLNMPNVEGWKKIRDEFQSRWNFPNTLGAIDGKHIEIQCPVNSGSQYYNYKHFYSLVLLACCDAEYKFIWVDIGAYGSENDAGVFRRSQIGQDLNNGTIDLPPPQKLPESDLEMPHFFVGDEAFPLKPYIMRPYPGKYLGEKKNIFNYRLSRARRTIENAFGILASRWRVYRQPMFCSVKTVESIVKATVCLHNYLRTEASTQYSPCNLIDTIGDNGEIIIRGEWRNITQNDKNLTPIGRLGSNIAPNAVYKQRDSLSDYLISAAGSVPWQWTYVNRGK